MIALGKVLLAMLLLLGPVIVAELGLRALITAGRLPAAPSSSLLADVSIANLERLGRPDVLVIGTSAIRSALKPATLEDLLSTEIGRPVAVQSVAQGGLSFAAQRLLIRKLAALDLLPRTVITGLSAVSLQDGSDLEDDWFLGSELGRLWSGCEAGAPEEEALDCLLGQVSALWRWRGRPERIVEAITSGMPVTIIDNGRLLQESGWLSTNPSTAARLEENISRALARVEDRIDLSPATVDGFAGLVEELRAHGVELVAVELPYFPTFEAALSARNPDWAAGRDAGFAALEEAAAIEIIDVDGFDDWTTGTKAEWFRDPRHLSRVGAGPFTRHLWQMPEFRAALLQSLTSAD